ncbi:methyl-accepting chemotaxis protein [Paenibacillus methanolicus]|uniref:Methyl-accepting chemotaxis protein n=1 Tax=Paenibacillus methanolicus TaxID=582686 RepID=A0A5S5CB90_9BACL|nr:methyl-accepting chemotaxis protein [Paenibacillus methanolicus]TYP76429.1 methyl-accepting chemotaxis protein [Paenibacillus methanolicus]
MKSKLMGKIKLRGLFAKILLTSAACMIVPMLVALWYATTTSSGALETDAEEAMGNIVAERVTQMDMSFAKLEMSAKSMATNPLLVQALKEVAATGNTKTASLANITKYLTQMTKDGEGLYENAFVAYQDQIVADGIDGHSVGADLSGATPDEAFQAMESGPIMTPPIASPATGRPAMAMMTLIPDGSTGKRSFFGLAIELNYLSSSVVKQTENGNIKTFMVNGAGIMVANENTDQVLKFDMNKADGDIPAFFQEVLANKKGVGYFTLNGEKQIASYGKSGLQDMYIISFKPVEQYMHSVNDLKNGLLIVIIGSIILFTLILTVLSYRITTPIIAATESLQTIAGGDFSQPIPAKYMRAGDETGTLMRAMDTMQTSVSRTIRTIMEESDKLTGSVTAVSSHLYDLNGQIHDVSGTTEQMAAAMEETAASTEEMSQASASIQHSVDSISGKAKHGASTSKEVSQRAEHMRETAVASSERAAQIGQQMREKLGSAIEQSKAVDQIQVLASSILEITSQTNLLALNANIEAARAGEAGRGFAVVADEIRKLAEVSGQSANQIRDVVQVVTSSVENLKSNSERMLEFIDQTVIQDYNTMVQTGDQYHKDAEFYENLLGDFHATADELSNSVQNMVQTIREISIANNESADGTELISDKASVALNSSNKVLQVAGDTKASAEQLKKTIENFKI